MANQKKFRVNFSRYAINNGKRHANFQVSRLLDTKKIKLGKNQYVVDFVAPLCRTDWLTEIGHVDTSTSNYHVIIPSSECPCPSRETGAWHLLLTCPGPMKITEKLNRPIKWMEIINRDVEVNFVWTWLQKKILKDYHTNKVLLGHCPNS